MKIQLFSLVLAAALGTGGVFYALSPRQQVSQDIAPGCGVVRGRVVDERGRPVSGVKVYSMILDRPPRGREFSTVTDQQGLFFLGCAEPGRNAIYVAKEEENYPDTLRTPFIDNRLIPVVNVSNRQVTRDVEIRLPPKAARLTGRIVDALSQQPIEGATLTLCRVDYPYDCRSLNANQTKTGFSQLIPPMALKIKASAPGHEDWFYGGDGSQKRAEVVLLAPQRVKNLVIALKRKG